ncbi:unnamed protein product [Lactuca saligna]|uniref:NAD(P)-binding domain-containing protein n=1 Tax=Lactuca saligna TaxID=75948 RepID=A0AA36E9W3_LACSI|nr:unnamed protein product [Lactuca saligna]
MAPALTSNSFLLATTPHTSLASLKNPRRLIVCAKKSDVSSAGEGETENRFRFNFDFGKVSDMKSLIPVVSNPSSSGSLFGRRKDPNTVFVAGATGQAGISIAQTLLREGFSVRAGVPELSAAQDLARLAVNYKVISLEESKRLNAVESTFQDPEAIAKAIGNASKAVVTIGPFENGPTTEVTTSEALEFIQAAQLAGVSHVAIIYDTAPESTTTNNVLDGISSFFNNLFTKSQPLTLKEFLDGLIATDVKYTLIKTKLTDDYSLESSYNVVVNAEGITTENDYKVSKSRIASLIADVFSNTEVAENKVVEVATSPNAAAKPVSELFSAIPEDGRRKAYAEAKAKAEEVEEKEVKKLEAKEEAATATPSLAEDVQEKATTAARKSFTELMDRFKSATQEPEKEEKETSEDQNGAPGLAMSWDKLSSGFASAVKKNNIQLPKVQVATVRGQAKARALAPKQAVVKKAAARKEPRVQPKAEKRKIFGGVFQQETIYVDD